MMKIAAGALLAGLMLASLAAGQKLELKLDALAAKASAKNEVDLDGALLKMALGKAAEHAGKEGKEGKRPPMSDLLAGVEAVHVRHYEFEKPGAYSDQELEPVRTQVGDGSGWSRIINIKEKNESTEIFLWSQGEQVRGCLVLVAEPRQVTVVHIGGSVTLAQMKEMVSSNVKFDLSALLGNAVK